MQVEQKDALPEKFTVYVARHATPDRSRYDIPYHIPPGPDLTDRGRQQAQELGLFLRESGVMHVVASPLVRAWNTALIASEAAGTTHELNTDLAEWRPEENEPLVQERMRRAFGLCAKLSAERGPVALVSHGAPVLTLLKWLGLPSEIVERCRIYDSRNLIPMAGAWRITRENGAMSIRLVFAPSGVQFPTPVEQ